MRFTKLFFSINSFYLCESAFFPVVLLAILFFRAHNELYHQTKAWWYNGGFIFLK